MCSRHDFEHLDSASRPLIRAAGTDAMSPEDAGELLPGRARSPRSQPDAPVTYSVPIRSQVSDEPTFYRVIKVWGPRDLEHQMAQLREDFPDTDLGSPRRVA